MTWQESTKKVDVGLKIPYASLSVGGDAMRTIERVVMSPEQCRAGRAWLGWTQGDLSRLSRVGLSTLKDFESGGRRTIAATLAQMQQALERAGVTFHVNPNGGPSGISVASTGAYDDAIARHRHQQHE
jgi:hypothetical protein